MKALSIRQPWAWAILHAGKDVENRMWSSKVRGTILVHASGSMTRKEYALFGEFFASELCRSISEIPNPLDLPLGKIVGTVEVVDCVTRSPSAWFFGPYGFVLANPRPFAKPIPFKGALGFFDVPDDLVREARAA